MLPGCRPGFLLDFYRLRYIICSTNLLQRVALGAHTMQENQECWKELCGLAAIEKDPAELIALALEINPPVGIEGTSANEGTRPIERTVMQKSTGLPGRTGHFARMPARNWLSVPVTLE